MLTKICVIMSPNVWVVFKEYNGFLILTASVQEHSKEFFPNLIGRTVPNQLFFADL